MIIDKSIVNILLTKKLYRISYIQSCAISCLNSRPVSLKYYDSRTKHLIFIKNSPNYKNSFINTIQIQRSIKGGPGYSNFAQGKNARPDQKPYSKYYPLVLTVMIIILHSLNMSGYFEDKNKMSLPRADAASIDENTVDDSNQEVKVEKKKKSKKSKVSENEDAVDNKDENSQKKKKHISFRDRKVCSTN
jgi:hypothetical protein